MLDGFIFHFCFQKRSAERFDPISGSYFCPKKNFSKVYLLELNHFTVYYSMQISLFSHDFDRATSPLISHLHELYLGQICTEDNELMFSDERSQGEMIQFRRSSAVMPRVMHGIEGIS